MKPHRTAQIGGNPTGQDDAAFQIGNSQEGVEYLAHRVRRGHAIQVGYMRKTLYTAIGVIAAGAAGYFGYSQLMGGGPKIDQRLGSTSNLMGSVEIPAVANSCDGDAGYARMICLIDLLKADASDDIMANLQLDYSVAEAQNWSNLPAGAFPARPGVLLGEFSTDQLGLVKAIWMEAASQNDIEGFDEMVQTLNADDYIGTVSDDTKAGYSSYNSKFAFLGAPGDSGTWQL